MKNILRLTKYAFKYKKSLVLAIFAMLAQVFVGFYIPFIMKDIIDVALPAHDFNTVAILSLSMLALALLGIACGFLNTYTSQYISQYASAELRLDLFNKIQTLSFKNIDTFKASRLITNATNDIVRVQMYFTMMLRIVIRAPMMIVMGLFLAISTSIQLSQVFFITMPLLAVSIVVIMLFAYPRFRKVQTALDDLNNVVLENANAPQVVKSFVSQPHESERFEDVNENYRAVNTSAETVMAFADPVINVIFNAGIALILFLGTYYFNLGPDNAPAFFTDEGLPRIGLLMAFNSYSQQILIGLMMFAMIMIFISRAEVSAARITEVLDADVDLMNPDNPIIPRLSGDIRFENVSFGYGDNANLVLKNIDFHVEAGEKFGIIGSTGSGKSTLVSLIPRLYDVKGGRILLDGLPLKDLDIPSVRSQIGFVTQQAIIFSGSVATNILQGDEGADLEKLKASAKQAQIHDFLLGQEGYFNHLVQAKGANLSGGQKQRVSMARALIKRPSILILDDVTSAVDTVTERKVLKTIDTLPNRPTMLCISQKVSTVRRMDRIMVLDNHGEIDGIGTHEQLLECSPVYREIVGSQVKTGGETHA